VKILLVDDHRLVADAVAILLNDLAENVEVTICHSSQHALSVIDESMDFDLILSDIYMPGIDGLGFLHGLRNRNVNVPIVIISSTENQQLTQAAYDQGASGFINKSLPGKEMLVALRKVLAGETLHSSHLESGRKKIAVKSHKGATVKTPATERQLAPRQLEVLQLISQGNSNKQIALLLEISEATVKYHTTQIFRALGVHNRTSCVREARQRNLISHDAANDTTHKQP